MDYLKADEKNPYMGLYNKTCENPEYWCRLHEVWLSSEDVARKHCTAKLTYDMIETRRCNCLTNRELPAEPAM